MQYKSKPHKINAFQFTLENIKKKDLPQWFEDGLVTGLAQITINSKDQYIALYSTDGGVRKAFIGDWICCSVSGVLFPMPEAEFEADFELDT